MVLLVLLVTTILLYDLVFNVSCFFPEKLFFFLHLVASVLYSHVIMASISEAFPNFARLPYRLYIPSSFCQTPIKKWHANGVGQVFVTKIDSNLGVLQWAMLLLLCLCLQQFKTRHFHLILLSNLLCSTLTLACVVVTGVVLMNWKVICNTCSRQIVQYSQTLNYLLEIIFFPSIFIINLFLHLLEPFRKTCLQFRSTSKYSLVQYFWSLASKVFLSTVMVACLLLHYSILFNITTIQSLAVGNSVPFYLAATVLLLTISALPCRFLAVLYLVTAITVGESFDASSIHPTDIPLLFPALYLFLGMLLSYSYLKMVKFHHPGVFLSMVFKSKRFVTSILALNVTGKSHSFSFAPCATVFDLRSQMNSKFNITSDLYWLSNRGKPLHDFVSLKEISGAVIMNGHLSRGAKCCLKGCENDAGTRKFDSLIGRYEIKCSPQDLIGDMENVKNLRVCDKYYASLASRGHKPAKGKSSSKCRSDA